ncbi:hypothetical protein GY45DRAFT_444582 [Cubamyces sp. BRFM 1775]|nr:hypothetical protein GY45DRAFT_444582 [Cubamyces sp. BRFM 1775]
MCQKAPAGTEPSHTSLHAAPGAEQAPADRIDGDPADAVSTRRPIGPYAARLRRVLRVHSGPAASPSLYARILRAGARYGFVARDASARSSRLLGRQRKVTVAAPVTARRRGWVHLLPDSGPHIVTVFVFVLTHPRPLCITLATTLH